MDNRKLLFICYHFPPDSAVGAIRPAKFVKYLRRFGWQSYVVTIKEDYIRRKDYDRMKEVEHIPIMRTDVWPTVLQLGLNIRDKYLSSLNKKENESPYGSEGPHPSYKQNIAKEDGDHSWIETIKRWLNSIFELPDREIGWLIPAVWKAHWLVKKEKIKVVIASSPPRTTALVGLLISWLNDVRLVTDLRDPWYLQFNKQSDSRSLISDLIEKWLEKKIMKRSCRVVTTTENYRHFLEEYYSSLPKQKFCTIGNGYDEEDFEEIENVEVGHKFIMSYLGTFYYGRSPKEFLTALQSLIKESRVERSDIVVNFIGDVDYADGESVEDIIKSLDLSDCVRIQKPIPYKQSLLVMKRSTVLLLFAPDQRYCIPGKAFEYLAARRKILCLSRNGSTSDLIKKTGGGITVDPQNVEEIKGAVQQLYSEYKKGEKVRTLTDPSMFERKRLSKAFSGLIEECISNDR